MPGEVTLLRFGGRSVLRAAEGQGAAVRRWVGQAARSAGKWTKKEMPGELGKLGEELFIEGAVQALDLNDVTSPVSTKGSVTRNVGRSALVSLISQAVFSGKTPAPNPVSPITRDTLLYATTSQPLHSLQTHPHTFLGRATPVPVLSDHLTEVTKGKASPQNFCQTRGPVGSLVNVSTLGKMYSGLKAITDKYPQDSLVATKSSGQRLERFTTRSELLRTVTDGVVTNIIEGGEPYIVLEESVLSMFREQLEKADPDFRKLIEEALNKPVEAEPPKPS